MHLMSVYPHNLCFSASTLHAQYQNKFCSIKQNYREIQAKFHIYKNPQTQSHFKVYYFPIHHTYIQCYELY